MSKILIEIPDNVDYRNYDIPYFILDAITSGKLIPDNATNGDVIKTIFPNAKVRTNYYTYCVEVKLEFHSQKDTGLIFDKEWWNKPYKAERKDKEMTNGAKILNAFPNATTRICKNKGFTYIEVEQNDKWIADYDLKWWNEEYIEPTTIINKGD